MLEVSIGITWDRALIPVLPLNLFNTIFKNSSLETAGFNETRTLEESYVAGVNKKGCTLFFA